MVRIEVAVTTKSPLNIGSGAQQGTLAKRGMLKDRRGWPYIPASALKGKMRHAVEQVVQTLDVKKVVCTTNQDMCRENPCAVCRLFGSPWNSGKVRFTDLTIAGPAEVLAIKERLDRSNRQPRTTQRMGVSINRRRRVAEDALLYSTELFYPGVTLIFGGVVLGEVDEVEAGLMVAGLNLIPAMGRGKSGGLGWISVETAVYADETTWSNDQLLAAIKKEGAL